MHVPRLREYRLAQVLTQAELARAAGISKTTLNQVEQGKHPARISTVRKLAAALGVDPTELVGDAGPGAGEERTS